MTTRRRFDVELDALKSDLRAMGEATSQMLEAAVQALVQGDIALADTLPRHDDTVDRMEQDIEARCLRLLTRQQPVVATDLRFLSGTLKVITDVERTGDHAVNIARITRRLQDDGAAYEALVDVPRFGLLARQMLDESLAIFTADDEGLDFARIERAARADDEADVLYAAMRNDLRGAMTGGTERVLLASHLLFVAHYLERICDHSANIAERAAFLRTGQVWQAPKL